MVFTVGTSLASVATAWIGELCLNSCLFLFNYYYYYYFISRSILLYDHENDIGCLLVVR